MILEPSWLDEAPLVIKGQYIMEPLGLAVHKCIHSMHTHPRVSWNTGYSEQVGTVHSLAHGCSDGHRSTTNKKPHISDGFSPPWKWMEMKVEKIMSLTSLTVKKSIDLNISWPFECWYIWTSKVIFSYLTLTENTRSQQNLLFTHSSQPQRNVANHSYPTLRPLKNKCYLSVNSPTKTQQSIIFITRHNPSLDK